MYFLNVEDLHRVHTTLLKVVWWSLSIGGHEAGQ